MANKKFELNKENRAAIVEKTKNDITVSKAVARAVRDTLKFKISDILLSIEETDIKLFESKKGFFDLFVKESKLWKSDSRISLVRDAMRCAGVENEYISQVKLVDDSDATRELEKILSRLGTIERLDPYYAAENIIYLAERSGKGTVQLYGKMHPVVVINYPSIKCKVILILPSESDKRETIRDEVAKQELLTQRLDFIARHVVYIDEGATYMIE